MKKIKIGSFNILKGGGDRLGVIGNVIKELDLDICGIEEAVAWHENNSEILNQFASQTGYSFSYLAKANSKYNLAILSKLPLECTTITDGFKHCVLNAKIKDDRGIVELDMFFVHLSPVSEDERISEIEILANNISADVPSIIIGDFNSLSPRDNYNKKELLDFFKKNNISKYGVENLRFDVVNEIKKRGFYDVMEYLKKPLTKTVPTSSNIDLHHSVDLRIDYVFANEHCIKKVLDVDIVKNDMTENASDHYPIAVEIQL